MKRLRAIALATSVLSALSVVTPAEAANVSHYSNVPALRMSLYFTDGTHEISFSASSGVSAWGSGFPPSVNADTGSDVYFSVRNRATNTYSYAYGQAAVVIDPALNAATASGTLTNSYGTFAFSVQAAGTGAPNVNSDIDTPPTAGGWVYYSRSATAVAALSAPNGTFAGTGGGYLTNHIGTRVTVTVP